MNQFTLDERLAKDTALIGETELLSYRLMNDSQYPWVILVPRRPQVTELYQLNETDIARFWRASNALSKALAQEFCADKINVAALGNVVKQLHVHHVVRYQNDACWPAPVWGQRPCQPYSDDALHAMLARLRNLLSF